MFVSWSVTAIKCTFMVETVEILALKMKMPKNADHSHVIDTS